MTRERIIEALADLIDRDHPFEVSMSAVASHAGVSEPTLYRHFPTKKDLFTALSAQQYRDIVEGLAPRSLDDLMSAVESVFRRTAEHEAVIRWALASPDPERVPRNVEARMAMLREAAGDVVASLDAETETHLLRLLLLLTSPMTSLYWHDYLGLDAKEAARTAAWAIGQLAGSLSPGT